MDLYKIIFNVIFFGFVYNFVKADIESNVESEEYYNNTVDENIKENRPDNVFNGVYTECFLHLSYSCLQKKTLLYLKELNNLSEVSVIGDYVKFVKVNTSNLPTPYDPEVSGTDELAYLIDKAVDDFFDNHVLKFKALGRDMAIPRNIDEFVGRKKRKGGGGGGDMMGGHGHDDKKKMMMMAMMCMKMKLMMMVPAMMGMMGMMSFKGMMFSMMSFMMSKLMLLMKLLEKRGGAGGFGGGGGGGDGGWTAGGGGGAWMPAGGQDLGGGGYDANGQWQSRSIAESLDILNKPTVYYNKAYTDSQARTLYRRVTNDFKQDDNQFEFKTPEFKALPEISYIKPAIRYNNNIEHDVVKKPVLVYKKSNVNFNYGVDSANEVTTEDVNTPYIYSRAKRSVVDFHDPKSNVNTGIKFSNQNSTEILRKKRSILELLQNSYAYWISKLLGINKNRRTNFQKYKIINGMRYVYYPLSNKVQKTKTPKEIQLTSTVKVADEFTPIITADDFNKGEIMEGGVEARMHRKKFNKMKDTMNDTIDDDPWQ